MSITTTLFILLFINVLVQWLIIGIGSGYLISLWDSQKEAAIAINAALAPIRQQNEKEANLKITKEMYGVPERELTPPDNSAEDIVECVICHRSVNIIATTELDIQNECLYICTKCEYDIVPSTLEELEEEVLDVIESRKMYRKMRKYGTF